MDDKRATAAVIARAFTDAVNDGRHDHAAALLADDVEVVFPGARLQGREVWLESRRRQSPPEQLREEVAIDELRRMSDGAELFGRMIERWVESGKVASEMDVRIVFIVDDGLISRLEVAADPRSATGH
jgi:hypothetical protein